MSYEFDYKPLPRVPRSGAITLLGKKTFRKTGRFNQRAVNIKMDPSTKSLQSGSKIQDMVFTFNNARTQRSNSLYTVETDTSESSRTPSRTSGKFSIAASATSFSRESVCQRDHDHLRVVMYDHNVVNRRLENFMSKAKCLERQLRHANEKVESQADEISALKYHLRMAQSGEITLPEDLRQANAKNQTLSEEIATLKLRLAQRHSIQKRQLALDEKIKRQADEIEALKHSHQEFLEEISRSSCSTQEVEDSRSIRSTITGTTNVPTEAPSPTHVTHTIRSDESSIATATDASAEHDGGRLDIAHTSNEAAESKKQLCAETVQGSCRNVENQVEGPIVDSSEKDFVDDDKVDVGLLQRKLYNARQTIVSLKDMNSGTSEALGDQLQTNLDLLAELYQTKEQLEIQTEKTEKVSKKLALSGRAASDLKERVEHLQQRVVDSMQIMNQLNDVQEQNRRLRRTLAPLRDFNDLPMVQRFARLMDELEATKVPREDDRLYEFFEMISKMHERMNGIAEVALKTIRIIKDEKNLSTPPPSGSRKTFGESARSLGLWWIDRTPTQIMRHPLERTQSV